VNFAETQYAPEVFEAVLFGLGGMTPVAFLQTAGVQLDLKGEPVTDAAHESSVPKLYIIGDLIGHGHGGGSIISGFNSASRAVRHLLERYLKWPLPPGNGFARPSAQLAFLIWAHDHCRLSRFWISFGQLRQRLQGAPVLYTSKRSNCNRSMLFPFFPDLIRSL